MFLNAFPVRFRLSSAAMRGRRLRRAGLLAALSFLPFVAACSSGGGGAGWLRVDEEALSRRGRRGAVVEGDPCAVPSHKELREARAVAMIEAEIAHSGEYPRILPDGSSSNPDQVRFAASPGALALSLAASERLNLVDGRPHALTLVVYQLSDRVEFDQLASSREGVARLLEGGRFDTAVKAVRRLGIQPGMRNTLTLERAEDARHVAIVAGYHHPAYPAAYMRVFAYGIGQYSVKGATPMHRSKLRFRPLPLNLRVELGEDAMSAWETTKINHNMYDSVKIRSQTYHVPIPDATTAVFGS